MNTSWKTSLFGFLLAFGGGIVAAMATGLIDPSHLPIWFKDAAVLLTVAGGAGLGKYARDNDKSSEQVGAGSPGRSPTKAGVAGPLLLSAGLAAAILALPGCQSTPARVAYNTVSVPAVTVNAAMTAWGDYVGQYHPPVGQELAVKAAFEKYQVAELAAISAAKVYADLAASGNTNSLSARVQTEITSQTVTQALADLVAVIRSFGVYPPK